MVSRRVFTVLLALACVLPVAIAVVLGVARLLGGMQDADAAAVLDRVALAGGVVWAIDLICLVLALGINALAASDEPGDLK